MFFSWFLKQNNCPFSYFCTEISGMEDSKQVGEGVRNSHALCIKVPLQWLMVPSVTHKTTRRRFMENLINSYKKWWIAGCRWGIYRSRSPLDTKQTSKISWWLSQIKNSFGNTAHTWFMICWIWLIESSWSLGTELYFGGICWQCCVDEVN